MTRTHLTNLVFLFAAFLITLSAHAQLTSTIKGVVVDKQSQFTLPGVNIVLLDSDPINGVATDIDGRFRLENVPLGRQAIQISFLGYETTTMGNLVVTSGKELDLRIELTENITKLKEFVVTDQDDKRESLNKMNTVSARAFTVEEAGRYSGSLNDPARMARNYAGVSGTSDDRNDIIIRGNAPTGVLWRMEGIDIPSPNHFSTVGTTGGPVSMLNINNLANSDFMTGAWTAEYGNAMAGVFDLKLRNGNSDKREYLGQIGFNGFELGAEGPFKKGKRASYLANYRYSTLGVLDAMGFNLGTGAAIPQYQDLTFKLNFPSNNGSFSVWGVGGMSFIEFFARDADDQSLYSSQFEDSRFESQTGVMGASHSYFINEKTLSKLVLAVSTTQNNGRIDSVDTNFENPTVTNGFDREQNKFSANYRINRKFNARNNASIGVIADYYTFDMVDSVLLGDRYVRSTDFNGGATLLQSYAQWQHRFNDKLTLNSGFHHQTFMLNGRSVVEPRVGLKYDMNARHRFSAAAGLHSQMQPITVYFIREDLPDGGEARPNEDLDFTKSFHGVVAYDFLITENLRLKSELYVQYLIDVPIDSTSSTFSMLNEGADFTITDRTGLVNEGEGLNYGAEFTLERFYSKGYYILGTLSLFDSQYRPADGEWYNTAFNTNAVANLLAGKEFKVGKNNALAFDGKVTWTGGRPYTPIDLERSRAFGTEILLNDVPFSERYDPYFRADFKVTFRQNSRKFTQTWSLDIQNISNNENVFTQGFNPTTGEIGTTFQRGFFPLVQYSILF